VKNEFPEFYRPSEDELAAVYETATIVFDSNVLLSLYRTGTKERGEILELLEKVKDRLWIPHQVALEYHRNRLIVVAGLRTSINGIRSKATKGLEEATKEVDNLPTNDKKRKLRELIESVVVDLTKKFEELEQSEHLSLDGALINDPILAEFERLLDGKIGSKPSDDERNSRITEALRRQKLKQPPGYKDFDKDTDELKAGDYLLWAELLEYAKSSE
jgi:PIN like domain